MTRRLSLHRQGRLAEADALYAQALALKPDLVEAHNNRGAIRQMAGDWEGALACYDGALRHRPDLCRGPGQSRQLPDPAAALAARRWPPSTATLKLSPGRVSALNGRAGTLVKLKRFPEALAAYGALRAADRKSLCPGRHAGRRHADVRLGAVEKLRPAVEAGVARGTAIVPPFLFLGFSGDPALQLRCAQNAIAEMGLAGGPAALARRALTAMSACASAISPPTIASIRCHC